MASKILFLLTLFIFIFKFNIEAQNKNERIISNENKLDTLSLDFIYLQSKVDSLEFSNKNLKDSIRGLNKKIEVLKMDLSLLYGKVDEVHEKIKQINSSVANKFYIPQAYIKEHLEEFLDEEKSSAGCDFCESEEDYENGEFILTHNYFTGNAYLLINNKFENLKAVDDDQYRIYENDKYYVRIIEIERYKDFYEWKTFKAVFLLFNEDELIYSKYIFGSCGA